MALALSSLPAGAFALTMPDSFSAGSFALTGPWRSMLRLPLGAEHAGALENSPGTTLTGSASESDDGDTSILTAPFGKVTIKRIPDGRFALRNDKSDALIELVRSACKGRGQWNPRFRNWLIGEADLATVVKALTGATHPS